MQPVTLTRDTFEAVVDPSTASLTIVLSSFRQTFDLSISIDSSSEFDRSTSALWRGRTDLPDRVRFLWSAEGNLWKKTYAVDVYSDRIEFFAEVKGDSADIDEMRFFDRINPAGFIEESTRTKHFNDKKATTGADYATGSNPSFETVFCPEPNSYGRQRSRSFEDAQISVHADLDYRGGNFIANPGLTCFAVSGGDHTDWLTLGLAVDPGRHAFSDYEFKGGETFCLRLSSWGVSRSEPRFTTPRIVLAVGATPALALRRYVDALRRSGLVETSRRTQHEWWTRPIICGWGHQCYQADLFRIRSAADRPPDIAAYVLSTQLTYASVVRTFDGEDIDWGTLIIDARWFQSAGLRNVDVGRWPDLAGFIREQHEKRKKVLLWYGPWDVEGIPEEDCIVVGGGQERARNRPGRLSKFGPQGCGQKIAVDVSLPRVRRRIEGQIRHLLGQDGLDADGLKVDHVAAAPGCYGMVFPEGSGRHFGLEATRMMLALIYEVAKGIKPDALIIGQSPHPYFSPYQDMLRLGDIYSRHQATVLSEMQFRAEMARVADPSWLIDTDGWPMPSMRALREYLEFQATLGVPSLYYTTHLDTTGEPLLPSDYGRIRELWRRPR